MKIIKINLFLIITILLYNSCDTFSGATMNVLNMTVPIEKIYTDIMKNNNIFEYDSIEFKYEPPQESFEIFPNWGKKVRESYCYISIWVYGFGATIKYINSDIYISSLYMHYVPKDVLEFTVYKMNELKDFFKEKYNINDENIIIKTHGIK